MEIFAIGSGVIVDGDIPAKILAVEIRGIACLITYQCMWRDERNRKTEWLTEGEIKPKGESKRTGISLK